LVSVRLPMLWFGELGSDEPGEWLVDRDVAGAQSDGERVATVVDLVASHGGDA
jgi:hypothetical protein